MTIAALTYPKINTLFRRGERFSVTEEFSRPEYGLINEWLVTEKVDGTNVRLVFERETKFIAWGGESEHNTFRHRIAGKSDDAELHPTLMVALSRLIADIEGRVHATMDEFGLDTYVLFGEGYGPKIQSGGYYRADPGFILFDILAGNTTAGTNPMSWLQPAVVEAAAADLGIPHVPVLRPHSFVGEDRQFWTVQEIVGYVHSGFPSTLALIEPHRHAEGIVARPPVNLYDQRGERVMFKLKERDYREGKR